MAVLSRSVLNQTSVRSLCSTTADTTLSGRSQMASNHVATDAWPHSVLAFGFTMATKEEEENENFTKFDIYLCAIYFEILFANV